MARMGSKIKRSDEMKSIDSKFKNLNLCNLRDFTLKGCEIPSKLVIDHVGSYWEKKKERTNLTALKK